MAQVEVPNTQNNAIAIVQAISSQDPEAAASSNEALGFCWAYL